MIDQAFIFARGALGAFVSFLSGNAVLAAIQVESFQIEQGVVYGLLSAILFFVWRASAFVKGVNDKLDLAKDDRDKLTSAIERLDHKYKNLDKALTVMASRCPANKPGGDAAALQCRPSDNLL